MMQPVSEPIRTNRPIGLARNIPWEPRNIQIGRKLHLISSFVELVEGYPWIQEAVSGVVTLMASSFDFDNGPKPFKLPDPPDAWRFAAIGDFGSGRTAEAEVASNVRNSNPALIITTGDNVYPSGREQDYEKNFDPPYFYGDLSKQIPFMPAVGNHDIQRNDLAPYFKRFKGTGGRLYYTYTKNNVGFVVLDSNQDLRVGSKQYTWLVNTLKSMKTPWKVVYFHFPIYGRDLGDHEEIREAISPLFEKYGVQLVLNGHEHNYQRSIPIRGVTYITTGGGGQQVYPFTGPKPMYIARRGGIFHHVEVSVGATYMTVRAIDRHGKVYDASVIPISPIRQAKDGVDLLEVEHIFGTG